MSDTSAVRARREPVFNLPGVVVACVRRCCWRSTRPTISASSEQTQDGIVDAIRLRAGPRISIALGIAQDAITGRRCRTCRSTRRPNVLGSGGGHWWTLVTYALLHGSWAHVGFNCLWLAAFGAPVARRFGAVRFLALLLVASVVGALVQFSAAMASFVPVIGASAGVAGAMGAAVRFVFRPVARGGRHARQAVEIEAVVRAAGAVARRSWRGPNRRCCSSWCGSAPISSSASTPACRA